VAARLAEALGRRFPGLIVALVEAPPFAPLPERPDEQTVRLLNDASADLLFVGLGCPKQEKWMALYRDALSAPVLLGVGAAFDFLTGDVRQAPRWMMAMGLEWLYRLSQEPRRLWRRYVVYNPPFAARAFVQVLRARFKR
jgi:N-acetylglucosaminyldiphosphoundecaprenol N-acetyl-beta-D-mannosaminyltransferase